MVNWFTSDQKGVLTVVGVVVHLCRVVECVSLFSAGMAQW